MRYVGKVYSSPTITDTGFVCAVQLRAVATDVGGTVEIVELITSKFYVVEAYFGVGSELHFIHVDVGNDCPLTWV